MDEASPRDDRLRCLSPPPSREPELLKQRDELHFHRLLGVREFGAHCINSHTLSIGLLES